MHVKFSLTDLFRQKTAVDRGTPERLAVAQLLLEIARADLKSDAIEHRAIRTHLQRAFSLGDAELDQLVAQAAERVEASLSLHDTVSVINRELTAETKNSLVGALWRVAYADGRLDPYEEALLRRICDLLYVPHSAFIREKLAAQTGSGSS